MKRNKAIALKEMYIVNGGKLRVLNDELGTVLATLTAGAYFGEISLLNVGAEGNRRTASVLSVGYSELLCLSKKDIWEVCISILTDRAPLFFLPLRQRLTPRMC